MAVALASRFWRLGRPKIFHEVATRLHSHVIGELRDDDRIVFTCARQPVFDEMRSDLQRA